MYAILYLSYPEDWDLPRIGTVEISPLIAGNILDLLDEARLCRNTFPRLYHVTIWADETWMKFWDDIGGYDAYGETVLVDYVIPGEISDHELGYLVMDLIVNYDDPKTDEVRFRGGLRWGPYEFTSSTIARRELEEIANV